MNLPNPAPNILGLNFGHDAAAVVISGNRIRSAISNERLSRIKKAAGISVAMLEYVLSDSQLKLEQIDYIAFTSYLYSPENVLKLYTTSGQEIRQHVLDLFGGESAREFIFQTSSGFKIKAIFVNHHLAHCASAFYTSKFEQSACLSVDASLRHPEACSLYALGQGNKLHYYYCPGIMIGNLYSEMTAKLGIGPGLTKAGSMMGLAAYGKVNAKARTLCELFSNSYYERRFQPSEMVFIQHAWSQLSGCAPYEQFTAEQSDSPQAMEIAASMQFIFEESLLRFSKKLFAETLSCHQSNLCLAGGSFLNSEANRRIANESGFQKVHLFPACGDDGTAVGAALFVNHHILNQERQNYSAAELCYLGKQYSISPTIKNQAKPYNAAEVAQEISKGKVVAWAQGRSEFGPRALGNRSILADPRNPEMRDKLNKQVKRREWYRPFAPSILQERCAEWFDISFESPHMLFIAAAKQAARIPSAVHVDQSARLQTVSSSDNPRYYELIQQFERITQIPMLINTSLNGNGEPLAESPEDCLKIFQHSAIDLLVLGEQDSAYVLEKN